MILRLQVLVLALALAVSAAGPAPAQSREETLADVRQQLSVLYVEMQRLKRELSTTGGAQSGLTGGTALQRIDAIEEQLQRLTDKTEELQHRIDKVVSDGTNRIGDLEFRLCELETDCDPSKLGDTPTLGGKVDSPLPVANTPPPDTAGGAELAVGERDDFDRAKAALDAGDYEDAAQKFQNYTDTYPGGALSGDAHFFRGQALSQLGQTTDAARAYLQSFSGAPNGDHAPDALYNLGMALQELGQTREACVTLGEVGARFPGLPVAAKAQDAISTIGCN
ncbi:MAG: tol-pal system protein YbgF [Paracoccaceae bacterium]